MIYLSLELICRVMNFGVTTFGGNLDETGSAIAESTSGFVVVGNSLNVPRQH